MGNRSEIEKISANVEELWGHFDTLFDSLGPDDWSRPHGKDWVFADLPFHLAYFDREIVAEPLESGKRMPKEKQEVLSTFSKIGAWNERNFAARPADQTVEESISQMHGSRDAIRTAVEKLTDDDLDQPVWMSLGGFGWVPIRLALIGCCQHSWNEFVQFRIIVGRDEPVPSGTATHAALAAYMQLYPWMVNRELAATTPFKVAMEFTDDGVGPWTIVVADGDAHVEDGVNPGADLTFTQSSVSFVKTWNQMRDPAEAIETGEVKVSDMSKMGLFSEMFQPPM